MIRASMRSMLLAVAVMTLGATILAAGGGRVVADRYSSTNYTIDASVMNGFGGAGSSTNYQMVSTGGEAIIGSGTGGSYKLGRGYVAQLDQSLQLAVQPSGLKALYMMDETGGSRVRDASSNMHDGTAIASPGWASGKLSNSLDLSSDLSQYATVPDSGDFSGGSALTISLWANQAQAGSNRAFISQWDYAGGTSNSASWALQTSNTDATKLRFFVATSNTDPGNTYVDSAAGAWSHGSWKHIVIVYDGSLTNANRVKIYVDGASSTTSVVGTIPTSLNNAAAPLIIGDFMGLNRYWAGGIDHVKIYNRALSTHEVSAEYQAQNAGREAGLSLGTVIPGASNTVLFDAITQASTSSYNLAIHQNNNLTSGGNTIPAVPGTIASPAAWSEGTTKGLGFTLVSGTGIPGGWGSGSNYAALPGSATSFYTRTGYTPGAKDALGMRLRLDTNVTQPVGDYTNVMTITGTTIP